MKRLSCLALFALSCLAAGQSLAMNITSTAPGNVYTAKLPMRFTVNDVKGGVHYKMANYFGQMIAEGDSPVLDGVAEVRIPGQNPGWYQITCTDGKDTATTSVGVVINRGSAPLDENGRICTDAASAWLVPSDSARKPFARMMKLAGIPWVRERMSWDVEPEQGKLDWGKYQTVADSFSAEGVRICNLWHNSPEWTHPKDSKQQCPDDLRTVYRFSRNISSHFQGQVQAWEVWNEPDFGFWKHLGDRFAGFQKAAYLGLKDGNPNILVLNGSICGGVTNFVRNVYESGMGDYYDVFDWHTYADPRGYANQMKAHLDLQRKFGLDKRPA